MVCWLTSQFKKKSDHNVILFGEGIVVHCISNANTIHSGWNDYSGTVMPLRQWDTAGHWKVTRGTVPEKFHSKSDWEYMLWGWCSVIWKVWVQFLALLQISSRQITHILVCLSSPSAKGRLWFPALQRVSEDQFMNVWKVQCWRAYCCRAGWEYSLSNIPWSSWSTCSLRELHFVFPSTGWWQWLQSSHFRQCIGCHSSKGNYLNIHENVRGVIFLLFLTLVSITVMLRFCYWDFLTERTGWHSERFLCFVPLLSIHSRIQQQLFAQWGKEKRKKGKLFPSPPAIIIIQTCIVIIQTMFKWHDF